MVVRGIRWIGVATERYAEMRSFVLEVLGLTLESEDQDFLETTAANGDKLEIFGPGGPQPAYQFSRAPVVVGFLVEDIEGARDELAATRGVELLGELEVMEDGYVWQHFRAPDGLVYELTFDPSAR
jgi:Glyoxalase/Bleomycin resistance protein/Dioxygenase superfamily